MEADNKMEVWYQLYIGEEKEGCVGHVFVNTASNVATFLDEVKAKRSNALRNVDVVHMTLYAAGQDPNTDEPLRPGTKVKALGDTTDENPLIVVAPATRQQQNAKRRRILATDQTTKKVPTSLSLSPIRITVKSVGVVRLSSDAELDKWLTKKGVDSLFDSDDAEVVGFATLVDGGKYTCTLNQLQQQQNNAKRRRILATDQKAILPVGEGPQKFGGLFDRESAKEDLYKGLEYLATSRGNSALDKKNVPVLAIAAPSESGKTEFLRWIFNNCCTFNLDSGETAKTLLGRINAASPDNVPDIDRLLVLFASFSQQSTYTTGEGPIVVCTIERLVRSFEGRVDLQRFDAAASALQSWNDLVEMFLKEGETTGFIVCVDELSKLRQLNSDEYTTLMDGLLSFSQATIAKGGFFAFVGSSLYIQDFGEVVLQGSGRAMRRIKFPSHADTMENKTKEFVVSSQVFAGAAARAAEAHFFLKVAIQVARSSPNMYDWLRVAQSKTKVLIPQIVYIVPDIGANEVFLLAARTAFGEQKKEAVNRDRMEAVLDKLHGDVELHSAENDDVYRRWPNLSVTLSLPPWRLLQFVFSRSNQVFSHVQNWVLVELHRLFYSDGPSEAVKTWELATMGLLELRKAMLQVVRGATPSLCDIVGDLGAFLKVSDDVLEKTATAESAANSFQNLPLGSEACSLPCFFYTKKSNEEGVEGVFRNGFKDLAIFCQMKLYHTASPKEIKDWLVRADRRAIDLGYKTGTYIVQLFVTGTIKVDVEKYYDDWPQNSMVFADDAIKHLFKPFGEGLFVEMVARRRRKN